MNKVESNIDIEKDCQNDLNKIKEQNIKRYRSNIDNDTFGVIDSILTAIACLFML